MRDDPEAWHATSDDDRHSVRRLLVETGDRVRQRHSAIIAGSGRDAGQAGRRQACPMEAGAETEITYVSRARAASGSCTSLVEVAIDETGLDRKVRSKFDIVSAWMQSVPWSG
jgi:hypothetical protein